MIVHRRLPPWIELLLVSVVSLYVELLVIKWLSADIRAFTIFRNFPLVACFIGLGVGYALRKDDIFKASAFALLQTAVVIKLVEWLGFAWLGLPSTSVYQFSSISISGLGNWGNLIFCMALLVITLSGPFAVCACIGSRIGTLFDEMPPLRAYAVNLAGAILGGLLFTLLSFLRLSPAQLLIAPCLLLLLLTSLRSSVSGGIAIAVALVLTPLVPLIPVGEPIAAGPNTDIASLGKPVEQSTHWSPYQRLDLKIFNTEQNKFLGLNLGTNRSFYQYFFNPDLNINQAPKDLQQLLSERREEYSFPFRIKPAPDVLIIGAGTGQDAAAAVQNGAVNVDAVEIDPVIVDTGKKYNPYYSDARIHVYCDDARHFIANCKKQYDRVCFTLLDSHTVSGLGSSVRLDAYVYTKESVQSALRLLKPDGLMVLSFSADRPYIGDRLYYTLQSAAGYNPAVLARGGKHQWESLFFVLGPDVQKKALTNFLDWQPAKYPTKPPSRILTDDWPYLYVDTSTVDLPFLLVVLETVLLCLLASRRLLFSAPDPINWQMFFLGAGFLLMELAAIAKLSLLFGSTWLTAAIVINGILLAIFFANLTVLNNKAKLQSMMNVLYIAILVALLVTYAIPTDLLSQSLPSVVSKIALPAVFVSPLFIAGLIFPTAFSQATSPPRALAYNIMGAVVGGFLEYFSNMLGINALVLISLALYACAWLCNTRIPRESHADG